MDTPHDGGPAFPVSEEAARGKVAGVYGGMSQRALIATILMHSEAVTCGVPGEACDALIEASAKAGTDVIDHMAMNAVEGADALLRALEGVGKPVQSAPVLTFVQEHAIECAPSLAACLTAVQKSEQFSAMPADLQRGIRDVLELWHDDIPF